LTVGPALFEDVADKYPMHPIDNIPSVKLLNVVNRRVKYKLTVFIDHIVTAS
jgi:hypothetical protein